MEWGDYSGRKGRDGQKKKIGKANERKEKVKRGKWTRGEEGCPGPTRGDVCVCVKLYQCGLKRVLNQTCGDLDLFIGDIFQVLTIFIADFCNVSSDMV